MSYKYTYKVAFTNNGKEQTKLFKTFDGAQTFYLGMLDMSTCTAVTLYSKCMVGISECWVKIRRKHSL